MAKFVNPYNFVRSEYDPSKTAQPLAHDRIHVTQYSGRMLCSLQTITWVTTKSFERQSGLCIYGSTLKGMIRAVAEAVARACLPLGGKICQSLDHLCVCCRMFGWLHGGNVHQGRVHIGDAIPQSRNWLEQSATYLEWQVLSSPKPQRHPNFYDSSGQPRGRKFYYHHLPGAAERHVVTQSRTQRGGPNEPIAIAKAGQIFAFEVDFTDLSSAELGLLLYALQLEDNLYHKVGKAKPLGFGTAKITIDALNLLSPDRYAHWGACSTAVELLSPRELGLEPMPPRGGQGVAEAETELAVEWQQLIPAQKRMRFIDARIESFFQGQFHKSYAQRFDAGMEHMQDLRHMLSQHGDYPIHYPSKPWFDSYPSTGLPAVKDIEGTPLGDRRQWLEE